MKDVWQVWTAALNAHECGELVQRAMAYADETATIGFSDTQRSDDERRTSSIRWLDVVQETNLVQRLMQFVHSSNRTNFGVDITAPHELQFTEYRGSSMGHYDWHQDVWLESTHPFARKLSVVVQLSAPDEYEGGSFEFFDVQKPGEAFAPLGSILIFPSFLEHRVLPVTKGMRRSLVTWVEGPNWR